MLSISPCGLFGWNPNQFLIDIERVHRGDYKNPNSTIHVKFILWKVFQEILDSISRANRSVGLFRLHIRKNTKKFTLKSKHKYIKNTVATGIAQKSYKALFPLWSLKKKMH